MISGDLLSLKGVLAVRFELPSRFVVDYDPAQVTLEQILALEIFKTYKASPVS